MIISEKKAPNLVNFFINLFSIKEGGLILIKYSCFRKFLCSTYIKPIVKKGNKYLTLKSSFYKVKMSRYKLRSFDIIKATLQTGTSCKVLSLVRTYA